jgi:hypothetical protein
MADLDPQVLKETSSLLNTINSTLAQVTSKIQNVVKLLPGATKEIDNQRVAYDKSTQSANKNIEAQQGVADAASQSAQKTREVGAAAAAAEGPVNSFLSKYNIMSNKLVESAKNIEGGVGKMIEGITGLNTVESKILAVASAFSVLSVAIFNVGNSLNGIGDGLQVIGDKTSDDSIRDLDKFSEAIKSLGSIPGMGGLTSILAGVTDQIKNFSAATAGVKKLENALIGMRGAFGGFEDVSRRDFIANLDREIGRFNDTVIGVGNSTNTSVDEVQKYAFELMKIPGAYDEIVSSGDGTGRQIKLLEAAMRTARGTTGDFRDVTGALDLEFRQFGTTTDKSLDFMSRMYEMSQTLGVSFQDFKGSVEDIVKGFAALGNTSQSATELVAGLSRSLMQTGLGIEPTNRVIGSITKSMEGLGIAQKAFLSQQTGGAGGLQGAFQIDQMIAEGNVRGVYEKMEESLKRQFGGSIVTLEEGARDPNAAAQLTKQLAFLRQGPFGEMVRSDQDAYKLLEAFKAGTGADQEIMERGQMALERSMDADAQIQDKQRDSLVTIMNDTKALFREAQVHSALLARNIAGQGSVADVIRQAEEVGRFEAVEAGRPVVPGEEPDTFEYKGTGARVLGKMQNIGELVGGTGEGPGGSGLKQAIAEQIATPTLEIIKPRMATGAARGGLAPARGIGGAGEIVTPQSAEGATQPTVVAQFPDTMTLILQDVSGMEIARKQVKPKVDASKAVTGRAPK